MVLNQINNCNEMWVLPSKLRHQTANDHQLNKHFIAVLTNRLTIKIYNLRSFYMSLPSKFYGTCRGT